MSIAKEDETGCIETGHKDINRLILNCVWGMRSNYLSVPTDCPQRNERWGWSGDTQVFVGAAVYAADVYGFLSKWMTDMRDSQMGHKDLHPGSFRVVAPDRGKGMRGHNIGWSDAGVIVPWTLWKQYGDVSVINANWKSMLDFMSLIRKTKYITPKGQFQTADWLSMEKYEAWRRGWGSKFAKNPFWPGETDEDMRTYWNFLGACYRILDLGMMQDMAKATGRKTEAEAFEKEKREAIMEFRAKHLSADGRISEKFCDMQTPALFAIKLGLLPTEDSVRKTAEELKSSLVANGYSPRTGFLGTPIILDTFSDTLGDSTTAYNILLQRGCPGWLYSVDQGATTIWERWNGYTKEHGFGPVAMNSFNHYAYGAVMGWMYRTMAGIRPGEKGGYKEFILCPRPDKRIGWCKASLKTRNGVVKSEWRYEGSKCIWRFSIPEGTCALVTWGGTTTRIPSGDWVLSQNTMK
jgi:alpha-L-rhamnosidase